MSPERSLARIAERRNLRIVAHWLFVSVLSALALFELPAFGREPVIGIFGDLHGDEAAATAVFERFRKAGVTHVIGTGDFLKYQGLETPALLDRILSRISSITKIPKENIFLMPGNWERFGMRKHHGIKDWALPILERHGKLVTRDYDSYGYVKIGSQKIMVSHFPQHPISPFLLPPPEFRKSHPGQASLLGTMQRKIYPDPDVSFEIIAHTHRSGAYVDSETGKLVVNSGTLDRKAKTPLEPRSFMIYDANERSLRWFDLDKKTFFKRLRLVEIGVTRCVRRALKGITPD
ncbi:MAG: hypothetical protein A2428_17060 [Bdellovibrionales bacterium RIFOXYC1_FULL_54_43]|nr:MAG: hypothetical protein A2428_17060 [Bdellovibrionales bacterium RIFOXYC1_FULL_54_43]OFZ82551.1 MAG: hypothetical protein A2603_16715 [Bdellovibrionales bacterium RIFOXYD1_FULL_55_31]